MLSRISVLVFTLHVLALLCIGLRNSFYHFRCWLSFWWQPLYGWRPLRFHGLRYRFRGVCRLVLRLVARRLSILPYMCWEMWGLFLCTIFEGSNTFFYIVSIILFETFLSTCVRIIIHLDETCVTDIYVYELPVVEIVFWKWYQMFLLSAAIKCLRKLIIDFSIIKNE